MSTFSLDEFEELALCSSCNRVFDENERIPKLLSCKHYFCLECVSGVLVAGGGVRCVHCGRHSAPPGAAAALPTHRAVLALAARLAPAALACPAHAQPALWCAACATFACAACPEHAAHPQHLQPPDAARPQLQREVRLLRDDARRLAARRHDHLLWALDAVTSVKVRLETELAASSTPDRPTFDPNAVPVAVVAAERDRLLASHAQVVLQCRLGDLIRDATAPIYFGSLAAAPVEPSVGFPSLPLGERHDPDVFLANYCMAQLYARSFPPRRAAEPEVARMTLPPCPTSAFPRFYFELEVNGAAFGRVVIEVRDDAAPRMARNFASLATGETGIGYRGCSVFQCWENESVITGDFEHNDGRGGRAALEEEYFTPDETDMVSARGAVGMRRSAHRRHSIGRVGSQFRILLREMRGFTAFFGFVVEGLELVDELSRMGDRAGNPHSSIFIASCGKLG